MRDSKPLIILLIFSLSLTVLAVQPLIAAPQSVPAQAAANNASVLTQHNDMARTGANLQETLLNTTSVNSSKFGLLYSLPVSGHVYAQPLYMPNLTIPGKGLHNVLFVATMHNDIYAFDADDPNASTPLWHVNLGPSVDLTANPNIGSNCNPYRDIQVEVGTMSTPVIDPATNTMYLVAMTKETDGYKHKLHALNIFTGAEKFNGPVQVQATIAGTGVGSSGGNLSFNSAIENQRSSLLLANGRIYFVFAAYCDTGPYHGWGFGYNAVTLNQDVVFNDSPYGSSGGIWQAGQGLSADGAGNIYFMTGNGTFDDNTGLGNSFLKVNSNFQKQDSFTAYNQQHLNDVDADLGSSGVLLIPGTHLLTGGSKEGILYLIDRNDLGGYQQGPGGLDGVVQEFQAVGGNATRHIHGSPVYWEGPAGKLIYLWGESNNLNAFKFNPAPGDPTTGTFQVSPVATGTTKLPGYAMPGAMLSISADGSIPGTGIVWASHPTNQDANQAIVSGTLRAYDAANINTELWNSDAAAGGRDKVGLFAKFASPTVVNGKVYLPTFSNPAISPAPPSYIRVYGLLSTVVNKSADDGTSGSLSFSLGNIPQNQTVWLVPPGNTITTANSLNTVPDNVTLMGRCVSGPAITLNGTAGHPGLRLGKNDTLFGLIIKGFTGPQLRALDGGSNKLNCVKVGGP